jgi:hypothetical protein
MGMGPRIREDKRGTPILTFPHQGGREKLDSGFRRNDGWGWLLAPFCFSLLVILR